MGDGNSTASTFCNRNRTPSATMGNALTSGEMHMILHWCPCSHIIEVVECGQCGPVPQGTGSDWRSCTPASSVPTGPQ